MIASSIAGMYVVTQGLPIGRRRKPEDIARVVLRLASKHAWFVVGHILVPVEGFSCREPLPQHPWSTGEAAQGVAGTPPAATSGGLSLPV